MKRFIRKTALVTICLLANVALPLLGGLMALVFAMVATTPFGIGFWGALIGVNLVTLMIGVGNAVSDIEDMVERVSE